jgi:hypothetical protein
MHAILTSPRDSRMLRHLAVLLPAAVERLDAPDRWDAFRVTDPDDGPSYERLVCRDQAVFDHAGVVYGVAIHRFPPSGVRTAMHDHRFPLAVLPFQPGVESGGFLYDMPWELRISGATLDAGVSVVRAGVPYAIERHREVYHAVHSHGAHCSLVLVDLTAPPSRPDRLRSDPLEPARADDLRQTAWRGLRELTARGTTSTEHSNRHAVVP